MSSSLLLSLFFSRPICLPHLSRSIVHINVFTLAAVSCALHIYPIPSCLFLLHLNFFSDVAPLSVSLAVTISRSLSRSLCGGLPRTRRDRWPDVKRLYELSVEKHILGKEKGLILCFRKRTDWKKKCVQAKLFSI